MREAAQKLPLVRHTAGKGVPGTAGSGELGVRGGGARVAGADAGSGRIPGRVSTKRAQCGIC